MTVGMGAQELKDILDKHAKWLRNENGGVRADLRSADLRYADLRSANLRSADLRSANLSYADLSDIKKDFFDRLLLAKNEVVGLYDYLMKGKVDGQSYEDECACFVGTVAKVAKEGYKSLSSGLRPDVNSPTEKWFMGIRRGDIPQSNQVSDITRQWIEEFAGEHSIVLPKYKIVSSVEAPSAF